MEHIHEGDRRSRAAATRRTPIVSTVLDDGTLVETVHDSAAKTTAFVVAKDGAWHTKPSIKRPDGRVLVPFSPLNNLLTHRVVLLPSEPMEYGSKGELVGAVLDFIRRYVSVPPLFERLAAHYVLLTWLADSYQELPYLRVRGEPGSGKTRFLLTVGSLCNKPIFASGASTVSPLFRMLDSIRGTLILDEADFRYSDERAELVKILNNGTVQGFPVLRAEANADTKEFNPRAFHVFGPKLVATRGPFEDPALESRFISESMVSEHLREHVPISLTDAHREEALRLRNRLLLYRLRTRHAAEAAEKPEDRALEPRLNQMFGPLLSVVDDPDLRREVFDLARTYNTQQAADRGLEVEALILARIKELWDHDGRLPTVKEVAVALVVSNGPDFIRPITPRWIGQRLRRRLGLATVRREDGYVLAPTEGPKLESLFRRYGLLNAAVAPPPRHVHQVQDVQRSRRDAGFTT